MADSPNVINGDELDNFLYGTAGSDHINGFGGNDVLNGDLGDDTLDGGAGTDQTVLNFGGITDVNFTFTGNQSVVTNFGTKTLISIEFAYITGSENNDVITGGSGDDVINGDAGDDTIGGGDGDDAVDGGQGTDSLDGGAGTDLTGLNFSNISGLNFTFTGNQTVGTFYGTKTLTNIERAALYGSQFDDVITGGSGDDIISGDLGNDTLNGALGNDTLDGGRGTDTLDGGAGTDLTYLDFTNIAGLDFTFTGNQTVVTGLGTKTLTNIEAADIRGSDNDDLITGGAGGDFINGLLGNDTIGGGAGDDVITGHIGNDTVSGGAGNDTLNGDDGDDTLNGGSGDDDLNGDAGDDSLNGGDGTDRASLIFIDISGLDFAFTGNQTVVTGFGTKTLTDVEAASIVGSQFNDVITGGAGDDTLYGYFGSDTLYGGAGDDRLEGVAEDGLADTLQGGAGNDALIGEQDVDVARFSGPYASYSITGSLARGIVADLRSGSPDGTDTLNYVSRLQFSDGTFDRLTGTFTPDPGSNTAPTAVVLSDPSGTIAENNSGDVKVTDISVTDDGQGTNVLSLSGADAGSFEIRTDANTGAEELWFTGAADYETKTSYQVTVDVDDSSVGSSPDASSGFTLDITDVNEFAVTTPTDSDSTADAIAENATGPVRITASASDADGTTNGVSYSLVGAGGATGLTIGNFTINAGTGVVTLTTAYDREALDATGNVSVTVRASSADGSTADQSFAVAIGNVVENQTRTLTAGPDTFVAVSDDNWTIDGLAGNDSITTLAGADTVRGNGGGDVIVTGAGNDSITFSGSAGGFDEVDGGDDTDTVRALASGTIIGLRRLANVEAVTAAGFANVIIASSALADILDFTGVTLTGIGRIDAGAGDDQITGSAASDVIVGALGDDILVGGGGNDSFQVGLSAGVDSYDGGSGTDVITATAKNAVIGISSLSGIEQISNGNATNVSIAGSLLADVLDFSGTTLTQISRIDAGGGSDQVTGSTADDIILGGADDDVLAGGPGRDTLTGGGGVDTLTGGAGADKFAYANPSDSGVGALSDLVVDFSRAQSDRIDLSAIDANLNVKNDQKFSFIGSAAFSNKAGELRAEIVAGDTHIFGDVDGVNGADFEIRLDVATTLQAQDFVL